MFLIKFAALAAALLVAIGIPADALATSIDSSTITQVVKDVAILQPGAKAKRAAQVSATFAVPDIMKTGSDSRAEMLAPDGTTTRVGANTLFSFEPQKREINLQKGSILFNSPTGKGGGTIKTAAATASVLGTTLIVATTPNGGFKVLLLEGTGQVKTAKGRFRTLKAGQLVFALPGGELSAVLSFQLAQQTGASALVAGFRKPLPSLAKIEAAIAVQEAAIARGGLVKTGLLAGNDATTAYKVDPNSREVLVDAARGQGVPYISALTTDAIITSPQLDKNRVFIFDIPGTLFAGFTEESDAFGAATGLGFFLAKNTTTRTPIIDLSPYRVEAFAFLSLQDFVVEQTLRITSPQSLVGIFTGGAVRLSPGTRLLIGSSAVIATLALDITATSSAGLSFGSLPANLTGLSLTNSTIDAGGDLTIHAFSSTSEPGALIRLDHSQLSSGTGRLDITSAGDIIADGAPSQPFGGRHGQFQSIGGTDVSLYADGSITQSNGSTFAPEMAYRAQRDITLTNVQFSNDAPVIISLSAGGRITMNNVTLDAPDIQIGAKGSITQTVARNYGTNILMDALASTSDVTLTGAIFAGSGSTLAASVSIDAGNQMTLNNVAFQAQDVSLYARTLALSNVAFAQGSSVTLRSATGTLAANPNTNQPVQLGKVNFIQNVQYGGQPAQNFISSRIQLTR